MRWRRRHPGRGSGNKLVGLALGFLGIFLLAKTLPVWLWMGLLGVGLLAVGWLIFCSGG